jgi:hypothetical protein
VIFLRRIRLKTSLDAKALVERVVRAFARDELTEGQARTYGYLIGVFLKANELGELELRIEALEEKYKEGK